MNIDIEKINCLLNINELRETACISGDIALGCKIARKNKTVSRLSLFSLLVLVARVFLRAIPFLALQFYWFNNRKTRKVLSL